MFIFRKSVNATSSKLLTEAEIGKVVSLNGLYVEGNRLATISDVLEVDGKQFISVKVENDPIIPQLNLLIPIG